MARRPWIVRRGVLRLSMFAMCVLYGLCTVARSIRLFVLI